MFYKITLRSENKLSLEEKKKYIDSFAGSRMTYQEHKKRNQGFLMKFNHAIGFKNVEDEMDNTATIQRAKVKSPEEYKSPYRLLWDAFSIPIGKEQDICCFYIPDTKMKHPQQKYAYKTKNVASKFHQFLSKIFPELTCELEVNETGKPTLSLQEYALEYFIHSLEKDIPCTIEFRAKECLTKEEAQHILSIVNVLSDDELAIGQYKCKTCEEYSNGEEPYHIEIVYMTWYGRDEREKRQQEYGKHLFTA